MNKIIAVLLLSVTSAVGVQQPPKMSTLSPQAKSASPCCKCNCMKVDDSKCHRLCVRSAQSKMEDKMCVALCHRK